MLGAQLRQSLILEVDAGKVLASRTPLQSIAADLMQECRLARAPHPDDRGRLSGQAEDSMDLSRREGRDR